MATTNGKKGDLLEAERLFNEAIVLWRKTVGDEHHRLGTDLRSLGIVLQLQEKYSQALPYVDESLSILGTTLGMESAGYGYTLATKSRLLLDLGAQQEAFNLASEGLRIVRSQSPPEGSYSLADAQEMMAQALIEVDSSNLAIPLLKEAIEFRMATVAENHPTIAIGKLLLGLAYSRSGDQERARTLLVDQLDFLQEQGDVHPRLRRMAQHALGLVDH